LFATEPTTGIEPVTYHLQGSHEIIPKAYMKDKVRILPQEIKIESRVEMMMVVDGVIVCKSKKEC